MGMLNLCRNLIHVWSKPIVTLEDPEDQIFRSEAKCKCGEKVHIERFRRGDPVEPNGSGVWY